jgi:hypothetical protein
MILTPEDSLNDLTEQTIPVKKQEKLLGTLRPMNGHRVFQLDISTGEVTEAEYENEVMINMGRVIKKIKHRPFCIYQCALNLENAKRKFLKIVQSELEKPV